MIKSWYEIDPTYKDFAKQSELEKTAEKLFDFGKQILKGESSFSDLNELLKNIRASDVVKKDDFLKHSKEILDAKTKEYSEQKRFNFNNKKSQMLEKKPNSSETDDNVEKEEEEPKVILSDDEISDIMEDIMKGRIKLTNKMSAEGVKCTSEEVYAQYVNMWHVKRENGSLKKVKKTWKLPSEEELNVMKEKLNQLFPKLFKIQALIKEYVNDSEKKDIDEKIDDIVQIKTLYDEFDRLFKAVDSEFKQIKPQSDIDIAIFKAKFHSMHQNDAWVANLTRLYDCITNCWKDIVILYTSFGGLKLTEKTFRDQLKSFLSESLFDYFLNNNYTNTLILLTYFSVTFKYFKSNLLFIPIFGFVLLWNWIVCCRIGCTLKGLKGLPRENAQNMTIFRQIDYQLKKVNERFEKCRKFLELEGYIF